MLLGEVGEEMRDAARVLGSNAGGEEGVEGDRGVGCGGEAGDIVEGADGVVDHAGGAVGEDDGGEEGFVGRVQAGLAGLEEGLDIGEAAGPGKAADGQVDSEAGGDRGGGGVGDGG